MSQSPSQWNDLIDFLQSTLESQAERIRVLEGLVEELQEYQWMYEDLCR